MNKIKSRPSAEILSNPISPLLWAKNAHGREWIRVKCRPYAEILYNISSKFDDPPAVGSKMTTSVLIRVKSRPCAEILSLIPYPSLMSRIARTRISIPHLNI